MQLIKICFYFLAMFNSNCSSSENLTIIGTAENAKAGATVINNKDHLRYYVGDLSHWDEKIIGKIVRVSGKLKVENTKPQDDTEELKQQLVGIKRTITDPHWTLVK